MLKISRDLHPNIVSRYKLGETLLAIADSFNVSRETIAKIVRKAGVKIQHGSVRMAESDVDHEFFERDTEEAAYFFGFLLADGNISDRGKVSIGIQKRDEEILHSLKEACKINSNVAYHTRPDGTSSAQLVFTVKSLSESLTKLGLTPRKSLNEECPERFLFNRDFWRGAVDGDGCVVFTPNASPKVYLCGSELLCSQFLDFCKSVDPTINTKPSHTKNELFRTTISGTKASRILSHLYENSNYHLTRKKEKALTLIQKYRGSNDNS